MFTEESTNSRKNVYREKPNIIEYLAKGGNVESYLYEMYKDREKQMVFISYAREDSEAAKRLYEHIKDVGRLMNIYPWIDKDFLIGGQNWKIAINKAIKKSRYFIPIFSSISVAKRGYVQKEFRYALDVFNEFPESRIFVIPVRLDDCEIPYEKLKDIHYIDLFPDWNEGMKGVIHAIAEEQWEEGYYPHS
jgi:hypothetical protein